VDLKEIKELMDAMEHSKIRKLRLKLEDFELELEKGGMHPPAPTEREYVEREVMVPAAPAPVARKEPEAAVEESEPEGHYITSPMVGAFYRSPSPQDPEFVKVGDEIKPQSLVCIIEAMKVMNEVKALTEGKVAEILLKDGDPVEFGTKLFRII